MGYSGDVDWTTLSSSPGETAWADPSALEWGGGRESFGSPASAGAAGVDWTPDLFAFFAHALAGTSRYAGEEGAAGPPAGIGETGPTLYPAAAGMPGAPQGLPLPALPSGPTAGLPLPPTMPQPATAPPGASPYAGLPLPIQERLAQADTLRAEAMRLLDEDPRRAHWRQMLQGLAQGVELSGQRLSELLRVQAAARQRAAVQRARAEALRRFLAGIPRG